MLSTLYVRLVIKVKVGIPESFKVGWYPHKITGWSHLKKTVENWQKQQRKEKNRTTRNLKLCFLSKLLCLLLKFNNLIFKPAILLKFVHFQYNMCIRNKHLGFFVVFGLPHILTLIIFLTNVFTNKLILRHRCHFAVCSGNFRILERFEKKAAKMTNVSVCTE